MSKKVLLLNNHIDMANVREFLGKSFNGFFSTSEYTLCTIIDTLHGVITACIGDSISKDKENNFIIINKTK